MSTRAGEILREAADLVDGPRNAAHGEKKASFAGIAAAWNWYLGGWGKIKKPLLASDVAAMMQLLKMTRPMYGEKDMDHYRDNCGYAGIVAELVEHESGFEMVDDGSEFQDPTPVVIARHIHGSTPVDRHGEETRHGNG